eukprot:10971876-Alexandrium_andersonii.AAC.1
MLELHHRVLESVDTLVRHQVVAEVASYRLAPMGNPPTKAPPAHLLENPPAGYATAGLAATVPPEKAPLAKAAASADGPPQKALP